MYSGDTKNINVQVKGDKGKVNLTGAVVRWSLRKSMTNTLDKDSISGSITITNPSDGLFTIRLNPADTHNLVGVFVHEAEVTDHLGAISTILVGRVTILKSIVG